MNERQLRAYGQLAQAIALHVFAMAERNDTQIREQERSTAVVQEAPSPIYHHDFMSTFEKAADSLCRLGIMRDLFDKQQRAFVYFVFVCDVNEAGTFAERNWASGPSFDDLLVTFLDLFGDFGAKFWGFCTAPRRPFGLGSRIEPTFDALASAGYLTKTEHGYVWTHLVARSMFEAGYWTEAGEHTPEWARIQELMDSK